MFDFKTVSGTGQIGGQGTGQELKFLSPTEPWDNFLPSAQVVQNTKIIFCLLNIVQDEICSISSTLYCAILSCIVLSNTY
jgi:hypothetical protein